jgi:hypothetical protein
MFDIVTLAAEELMRFVTYVRPLGEPAGRQPQQRWVRRVFFTEKLRKQWRRLRQLPKERPSSRTEPSRVKNFVH